MLTPKLKRMTKFNQRVILSPADEGDYSVIDIPEDYTAEINKGMEAGRTFLKKYLELKKKVDGKMRKRGWFSPRYNNDDLWELVKTESAKYDFDKNFELKNVLFFTGFLRGFDTPMYEKLFKDIETLFIAIFSVSYGIDKVSVQNFHLAYNHLLYNVREFIDLDLVKDLRSENDSRLNSNSCIERYFYRLFNAYSLKFYELAKQSAEEKLCVLFKVAENEDFSLLKEDQLLYVKTYLAFYKQHVKLNGYYPFISKVELTDSSYCIKVMYPYSYDNGKKLNIEDIRKIERYVGKVFSAFYKNDLGIILKYNLADVPVIDQAAHGTLAKNRNVSPAKLLN